MQRSRGGASPARVWGSSLALAVLIGVLGAAPHLVFSQDVGELRYFKSAYDEDTYVFLFDNRIPPPHRLLSFAALRLLLVGLDSQLEWTLIAADFLFPFVCTLAAGYLAVALTRQLWTFLLLSLCLLFGQELFSLGNLAIWSVAEGQVMNLPTLRGLFPPWGAVVIPDYTTSYFSLFRTPEPQLSWIVLFSYLGFLVRQLAQPAQKSSVSRFWPLLCFSLSLPVCHLFVSLPLYGLTVLLLVYLWPQTAFTRLVRGLVWSLLLSLLLTGALWLWYNITFPTATRKVFIFFSSLPIITPAVVGSLGLLLIVFGLRSKRLLQTPLFALGLIATLTPIGLMNQQALTGFMISTRDWERNINYPLLLFGGALICRSWSRPAPATTRWVFAFGWFGVLSVAALVSIGQARVYSLWAASNTTTMAQSRALSQSSISSDAALRLVIEKPGLAPLLRIRYHPKPLVFPLDYTNVFRHRISPLENGMSVPTGRDVHQPHLFEFFARTAHSPDEVARKLRTEAKSGAGFYLHFLFSLQDSWYPVSDNRRLRSAAVLQALDTVIADYEP